MITIIIATALVVGTVKEVSILYSKAQQIETLNKELKFRKGQREINNNLNGK